jgi:effector-binding domain-containing protein
MRRNLKMFIGVVSVIIISVVAGFFITVQKSQETVIEARLFNVLELLNSPVKWKSWQGSLKKDYTKNHSQYVIRQDTVTHKFSIKTADHNFSIHKPNPVIFEVKEQSKYTTSNYIIHILPSLISHYTYIVTTTRVSLLDILLHRKNVAFATISDLKSFIQNPTAYYGYDFVTKRTIDTILVEKKTIVLKKNWQQDLSSTFDSLSSFIKANGLEVMQTKIVYIKAISKDSVEIKAGIPVDRVVPGKGDIRCFDMPKSIILVGQYKGPYNKRSSLSDAMEKFIQNHSLELIAEPYERYLSDDVPKSDSAVVSIEICYPIL